MVQKNPPNNEVSVARVNPLIDWDPSGAEASTGCCRTTTMRKSSTRQLVAQTGVSTPRRLHQDTGPRSVLSGRWTISITVILGGLLFVGSVESYRFFSDGRTDRYPVWSEHAARWSRHSWDTGQTLTWVIADDPGWTTAWTDEEDMLQPPPLTGPEAVVPFVVQALKAWSDIESADIRWEVSGVDTDLDHAESDDGRPTIFVDPDATRGSYAAIWFERTSTGETITDCDVPLSPSAAAELGENPWWDYVLIHEFGHCLGLAHAGALSVAVRRTGRPGRHASRVHPTDPAMSYGYFGFPPDRLLADDVVGASLLRPVREWARGTGTISGSLILSDGEPAAHAHISALPLGEEPLQNRVGAFSDADGEFQIEGLEPGHYALWAQPLYRLDAHSSLLETSPLDLDDTLAGRLVRVRAGRTSADLTVPLRRGRAIRPHAGTTVASQEPGPPIFITDRWGAPCVGIRVRGKRPYSPDGPLWFAPRESRLRGDRWMGTTLMVELSSSAESAFFDWAGGYRDWFWDPEEERVRAFEELATPDWIPSSSVLDVSISRWQIESAGSGARHTLDIAWPASTEASLRFRSEDDACDGEPMVVCDVSGCTLRQ